jgi:hypothetical protein
VLYDAKRHAHTAQGLRLSSVNGDLLWVDGGWPGSCHEHELIELAGLDQVLDGVEVASLLDRGFRGLAKTREHWHTPVGDRRTKDRLTEGQRAYNRLQAGLRALVEQSIAHLANAWSLRRWRGLLYRVRDVYRPPARWSALAAGSTGSPHDRGITDTSIIQLRSVSMATGATGGWSGTLAALPACPSRFAFPFCFAGHVPPIGIVYQLTHAVQIPRRPNGAPPPRLPARPPRLLGYWLRSVVARSPGGGDGWRPSRSSLGCS